MNALSNGFLLWLADFYVLTTILLISVLMVLMWMKQPVQKLALIRATLVGLFLLAVLCAIPNWSIVHLAIGDADSKPVAEIISEPNALPAVLPSSFEPSMLQSEMTVLPNSAPTPIDRQAIETRPIAPAEIEANQAVTPWAIIGATFFVSGSCLTMLWMLLGSWRIARLCRQSAPAADRVRQLLVSLIGASTLLPRLLVTGRLPTAVAFGLRQPTILLPSSLADRRDSEQLRSVLAHEWAHLDNGDLKLLAAIRLLMVLLWAQPLYWVLRVRLRLEQETLADAAAAELTSRHDYAQQLVSWARNIPAGSHQRFASAIGIWEGPSQLRRRIAILLDDKLTILKTCSRRWRMMIATACFASVASLSLFTLASPGIPTAKSDGTNEMDDLKVAIPSRVERVIKSHDIPFMTKERLKEIAAEFAALVVKHQRNDLSNSRKQAILTAIEKHGTSHLRLGSFQPTQLRSLNLAYLNLPDRLLTLQWKIWKAITRPPFSAEDQRRLNNQRRWMVDYVNGLPLYHTFTHAAAQAELTERLNDPLCSTLDRPMTDEQFADFQERLQTYPRDKALDNVVTHIVQKSLYAQHTSMHDIKLPFDDQVYGYGAGRVVHLNFESNRQYRGDTRALRDLEQSLTVVDAMTGLPMTASKEERELGAAFERWVGQQGRGDFGYDDAQGGGLFAVRGAKLILLDANSWIESDAISDDALRTLLTEKGKAVIPLQSYYQTHRQQHSTHPSIAYIGPYIGILTREGRLAVVCVEDFSGLQEIDYRVRPRVDSSQHVGSLPFERLPTEGNIYRWRFENAKGLRIGKGIVGIETVDGNGRIGVVEHVGGASGQHSGPVELQLEASLKDGFLHWKRSESKENNTLIAMVGGKTRVPEGSRMQIMPRGARDGSVPWRERDDRSDDARLTTDEYANLWEARFIRDGQVLKSIVFAARLIDKKGSDSSAHFQPRLANTSSMPTPETTAPAIRLLVGAKKMAKKEKTSSAIDASAQAAMHRIVQSLMQLRHKFPELDKFHEANHKVQTVNGQLSASINYDQNYSPGSKNKPAGSIIAGEPWCQISVDLREDEGEATQLKMTPINTGQTIRWNGQSSTRGYRIDALSAMISIAVKSGSEELRRAVNNVIDFELTAMLREVHLAGKAGSNATPSGDAFAGRVVRLKLGYAHEDGWAFDLASGQVKKNVQGDFYHAGPSRMFPGGLLAIHDARMIPLHITSWAEADAIPNGVLLRNLTKQDANGAVFNGSRFFAIHSSKGIVAVGRIGSLEAGKLQIELRYRGTVGKKFIIPKTEERHTWQTRLLEADGTASREDLLSVTRGYKPAKLVDRYWVDNEGVSTLSDLSTGEHRFVVRPGWPEPTFVTVQAPDNLPEQIRLKDHSQYDPIDLDFKAKLREASGKQFIDVVVTNVRDQPYRLTAYDLQLVSIAHRVFPPKSQQRVDAVVPARGQGKLKLTIDVEDYLRNGLWCSHSRRGVDWRGPTVDETTGAVYFGVKIGPQHSEGVPLILPKPLSSELTEEVGVTLARFWDATHTGDVEKLDELVDSTGDEEAFQRLKELIKRKQAASPDGSNSTNRPYVVNVQRAGADHYRALLLLLVKDDRYVQQSHLVKQTNEGFRVVFDFAGAVEASEKAMLLSAAEYGKQLLQAKIDKLQAAKGDALRTLQLVQIRSVNDHLAAQQFARQHELKMMPSMSAQQIEAQHRELQRLRTLSPEAYRIEMLRRWKVENGQVWDKAVEEKTKLMPKGLEFLNGTPEFADLRLDMTEAELKEIIARRKLISEVSISENGESISYSISTSSGKNAIVMFRGGECSGIQRMRDTNALQPLPVVPRMIAATLTDEDIGVSFHRPADWTVNKDVPPSIGPTIAFRQPRAEVKDTWASVKVTIENNHAETTTDLTSPPNPEAIASQIITVDGQLARLAVPLNPGSKERKGGLLFVHFAKGTRTYGATTTIRTGSTCVRTSSRDARMLAFV